MKNTQWRVLLSFLFVSQLGIIGSAEDLTGRFGLSGIAQAGFPLGQDSVRTQARDVGPDFGGMLRYGISRHWGAALSYDNMDLGRGIRVEPINALATYVCMPDSRWTPTTMVGLGAGRGVDTRIFNDLTAKAGVGIDYFVVPGLAVGPQVAYHYISDTGTESRRHAHVVTAGLLASYFFGGQAAEQPAPKTAAAPPTPASTPAPVAISLNPGNATLEQGQTQTFTASVTGTDNTGVNWSIAPELGSIASNGVYTAPATIALPEKVTVQATSQADASKIASAVVQLNPPAAAPQQVSIQLNVLFDTGKDIVKPEYNSEIQKVADFLKSYSSAKAEIEGHTDNAGSATGNQALSQRRAEAVRNTLINQFSVSGERLSAKGYGQTKPMADNTTSSGRAKNRRVVATITASK